MQCVYLKCVPAQQDRLIPNIAHSRGNGQLDPLASLLFTSGAEVVEDLVHLFKGLACSLGHEPVHPEQREETENGEENVGSVAGAFDQGRGDEADDEVEEPVGAG